MWQWQEILKAVKEAPGRTMARVCQRAHGGRTDILGHVHQEQKWRGIFWESKIYLKILPQWNNLSLNAAEMASLGSWRILQWVSNHCWISGPQGSLPQPLAATRADPSKALVTWTVTISCLPPRQPLSHLEAQALHTPPLLSQPHWVASKDIIDESRHSQVILWGKILLTLSMSWAPAFLLGKEGDIISQKEPACDHL